MVDERRNLPRNHLLMNSSLNYEAYLHNLPKLLNRIISCQNNNCNTANELKWTLGDLNPRPSGCKPDALPTELSALKAGGESPPFLCCQ